MDKQRALTLFLAVVEQGSYAKASVQAETSPSTISKAIARLERDLSVQLFQRNTRRLRLTDAGEQYAVTVRRLLEDLSLCEFQLRKSNDEPAGCLKLNLPVSYGRLYILPLLGKFQDQHPKIELQISFNDRYVDIIEQGIDVCIRSGNVSDSRLVVRQLSCMDFLLCASPSLIKQQGKPTAVEHFTDFPWVRFRFAQSGLLMPIIMPAKQSLLEMDPGQQFVVDDGEAMLALCEQGLGIAQMPHFIARKSLLEGTIKPLFPALTHPDFGVYLMYPKRDYLPQRVRCFVDFICAEIEAMDESARSTWAEKIM
ncbi:MAG: LysR family transcriptional regulator [Pseudomonadales bacterium]|nr:LysR family transcriptional regulator [Pseudomonadales bacterium]